MAGSYFLAAFAQLESVLTTAEESRWHSEDNSQRPRLTSAERDNANLLAGAEQTAPHFEVSDGLPPLALHPAHRYA